MAAVSRLVVFMARCELLTRETADESQSSKYIPWAVHLEYQHGQH